MSNLKKYNKAFTDTFRVTNKNIPEMIYGKCEEWDSVAHMELIGVIENGFGIMFDMEDIVNFNSYEKGKDILLKYHIKI